MSEVSQAEIKAAMRRYPGIPITLAISKYMLDKMIESCPVGELRPGLMWGGLHLERVGENVQLLAEAMYQQSKKSITITLTATDFPECWDHLELAVKDVDNGTPEEKEQMGFAGRPCCACKETITGDDTKARTTMLQKKAKWDYPTWGSVLDGTGGKAVALLCGKCVEENRQPEYALKLNRDDWANPKDIELVPLADLEDV
ncbi:hypothetical protein ES708_00255 [subsurface metagenome]